MNLVKEHVKCRDCGKEDDIEATLTQEEEGFFIHWDERGKEYFLCSSCEKKAFPSELDNPDSFGRDF